MLSEPKIVERTAQPYAGIKAKVAMPEISRAADELPPKLFAWLGAHGVVPTGAPFFKYNVLSVNQQLELEWGIPTTGRVQGDDRVGTGILPAGRYATLVHCGPYDRLFDANAALLKWTTENGLALDATKTEGGERFGCRLEVYLTGPRSEPDSSKWETEVAFRLSDEPAQAELYMSRVFDAPPALLFQLWTDPRHALRWWGPREYPMTQVEMDVRPGGKWRGCLTSPDTGKELWQGGVFREVSPPHRLVFTFAWEEEGERGLETLVTVNFAEQNGKTRMTFHQIPFRSTGERDGHSYGWNSTFDRLVEYLAKG